MILLTLIICITIIILYLIRKKYGCKHHWITTHITDFNREGFHAYRKYYMWCDKCGKNKSVKT